jgi:large subunit ribosomal protein L5
MVTLRGVRMYEFLDRFVTDRAAAGARLPRHLGSCVRRPWQLQHRRQGTDHLSGIEYDKMDAIRGLNISITTSAKNDDECKALLSAFRFPFKN